MTATLTPQKIKGNKPISLFVEFTNLERLNDEERIVEGYNYVNPKVEGDPWDLERSALENATDAYMRFPALREMHDPTKAAGTGLDVVWDDKGCLFRAKVVDDQAWEKVKQGVYKGFSIGGNPKVVRGKTIKVFDWKETSLVDRPADPDAVFTLVRHQDVPDEYEITVEPEETVERSPQTPSPAPAAGGASKPGEEGDSSSTVLLARLAGFEEKLERVLNERAQLEEENATLKEANQTLLTRLDGIESLMREQGKLLERIDAQPAGRAPVVRYPEALERTIRNGGQPDPLFPEGQDADPIGTLQRQYKTTLEDAAKEEDQDRRFQLAAKASSIKAQLAAYGIAVS